ncbi:receptor-like protein kinase FERONIA [Fagus crenata]
MEAVSHSISKLFRSGKRAKQSSGLTEEVCRRFSLAEIKRATNNFDKDLLIAEGGFISVEVYEGYIDDRTIYVAIKRLISKSRQDFDDLRNEVLLLCQLSHPNIVPVIGYCIDEPEIMIQVYKFMVNGSLRTHLYGTNHDPLPWKKRLQICVGVARGLHYLHAGVKHSIIHRNVKASNILLDEKWEAKLSDFAMSRMGPPSLSKKALMMVESSVVGTYGYMAPEYAIEGKLTDKSDIYSFGVLLLEVVCGRQALDNELVMEEMHLSSWTRKCKREGTINQIIDPYLTGKIAPECFKIYMDIATSCVRTKGTQRPSIGEVEVGLEHALQRQESADLDPGIGGGDQYMYPILEYTGTDSPPDQEDESVCESDSSTSARLSLDTAMPIGQ